MIERLRVRIPVGAAGEFSFPESTLYADSYSMSAYTLDPLKSEWADYAAVQAECGNILGNELTRNSSGNTQP